MRTRITAHSGADDTVENSLEFIYYCIGTGANALEVDVRRDKHGELVLSHDILDAENYDFTKIRLKDVFEILEKDNSIKINCDLKEYDLELQIIMLLEKYKGLKGRIIFSGSVRLENLKKYKEIKEKAVIYFNIEEFIDNHKKLPIKELSMEIVAFCIENSINIVNMNYKLCTNYLVRLLKENNIYISVWTVDNQEEIKRLASLGILNITTREITKSLETLQTYRVRKIV